MRFLLGGHSADGGGAAEGIGVLTAGDPASPLASGPLARGRDAAAVASPTWLVRHPARDVLYAVREPAGVVQGFRRTGEASFVPLGAPVEVGPEPAHALALEDALVVTGRGDGRVVRVPFDAAGGLGAPQTGKAARDPHAADAAAAADPDLLAAARALRAAAGPEYAHFIPMPDDPPAADDSTARPSSALHAAALPDGLVATADAGRDLVRIWRGIRCVQEIALPEGVGAARLLAHPSGHLYVLTLRSGELLALARATDGSRHLVSGVQLGVVPGDEAGALTASRDGVFLYAGQRGSDTVAVVKVRGAGEVLDAVALAETGVADARDHVVVRDALLVAGRGSDEVASLGLDTRTGVPGRVRHRIAVPAPTCILPFPA